MNSGQRSSLTNNLELARLMHMVFREEKEEEEEERFKKKKVQSFLLFHNSLLVNFLPTNPKKCSLYKFCIKIKNFKLQFLF